MHAARSGELPFLKFPSLCATALAWPPEGAGRELVPGLVESAMLYSARSLTTRAQVLAAALQMVVPELNLGAHHVHSLYGVLS